MNHFKDPGNLSAAMKKMQVSRDQYRTDLAEATDKLKIIEAAMQAMRKKYTRYGTESQCLTTKLLCSLIEQDVSFIQTTINKSALDLLSK